MNKVQVILDNFSEFEQSATVELFIEIFKDEQMGIHLWDNYVFTASHSLLNLWRMLNKEDQVKLSAWIQDNLEDLQFLNG